MSTLRWSWTLRVGPYLRATLGARPWLVAVAPLVGVGATLIGTRTWQTDHRVLAAVGLTVLVALLWVSATSRQLRRRQRSERARVQDYELTDDTLTLRVGRGGYILPLDELAVARAGRDWLAVRRRGAGRAPLLLLFDDPAVAPVVLERLVTRR